MDTHESLEAKSTQAQEAEASAQEAPALPPPTLRPLHPLAFGSTRVFVASAEPCASGFECVILRPERPDNGPDITLIIPKRDEIFGNAFVLGDEYSVRFHRIGADGKAYEP